MYKERKNRRLDNYTTVADRSCKYMRGSEGRFADAAGG